MEKKLWLMKLLSRSTGWAVGIHRGKRRQYYYLVSSKTGTKYRPWVGIVVCVLTMVCMLVTIVSFMGVPSVIEEYGPEYWLASIGCLLLTCLSGWSTGKLINMFESRPDFYDEDYEPTEEELVDWDNWVH